MADLPPVNSEKLPQEQWITVEVRFDGKSVAHTITAPTTIFGRSSKADILVSWENVSRKHFALMFKDGQWFIHDFASTNGTYLGMSSLPITPKTDVQVNVGDQIHFIPFNILVITLHPLASIEENAEPETSEIPVIGENQGD